MGGGVLTPNFDWLFWRNEHTRSSATRLTPRTLGAPLPVILLPERNTLRNNARVSLAVNPGESWLKRFLAMEFQEQDTKPTHLIRDNDGKYPAQFDDAFRAENVEVVRTCIRAPNMNAFIERWIQSLQVECLDHFVVLVRTTFGTSSSLTWPITTNRAHISPWTTYRLMARFTIRPQFGIPTK